MKNLILAFTALAFLVSCGLIPQKHKTPRARHGAAPKAVITPKPEISYYRPDLGNKINGVVIFPITDLRGKNNDETKVIDPLIVSEWAQVYGADKISSAGTLVDRASKVAGKDFYVKFIRSLSNTNEIEHLPNSEMVKKFTSELTRKFGQSQFAVTMISGGEAEYNTGQSVNLYLGLFDTENLTWRLITKTTVTKGTFGNWTIAYKAMISNSFNEIKRINIKHPR